MTRQEIGDLRLKMGDIIEVIFNDDTFRYCKINALELLVLVDNSNNIKSIRRLVYADEVQARSKHAAGIAIDLPDITPEKIEAIKRLFEAAELWKKAGTE